MTAKFSGKEYPREIRLRSGVNCYRNPVSLTYTLGSNTSQSCARIWHRSQSDIYVSSNFHLRIMCLLEYLLTRISFHKNCLIQHLTYRNTHCNIALGQPLKSTILDAIFGDPLFRSSITDNKFNGMSNIYFHIHIF